MITYTTDNTFLVESVASPTGFAIIKLVDKHTGVVLQEWIRDWDFEDKDHAWYLEEFKRTRNFNKSG